MKKKVLLTPIMAAFLFTACNNTGDRQTSSNEEEETPELLEHLDSTDEPILGSEDSESADMPTSENALDWAGTYEGTLPCEDCAGIKVNLEINSDGTYSLHQDLLDTDMSGTDTGTFTWDEGGNIVTLTNQNGREDLYQLGENQIIRLDPNGNRVQGALADQYILKKTGSE